MSLLFLANKRSNYALSVEKIEELYDFFVMEDYMDEECFIKRPVEILRFLGHPATSVGYTENMEMMADDEILHFERVVGNGKIIPHFVAGDGLCHVAYDPWGVSKTVREGELRSRRVFP
jgi:hypothetical protein